MWELNGIIGRNEKPPGCAGNFSGTAVVMGCGRCVWDDLARFDPDREKADVIAINNMILHWQRRVHHGVSLHSEEPNLWRALRPFYQCETSHVVTHSWKNHEKPWPYSECDYTWDLELSKGGSSGLLAVMIGLALGYDRIILAGVPMDGSGHFYDPQDVITRQFTGSNIKLEWHWATKYFQGRVKSLSGQTREWLGEP